MAKTKTTGKTEGKSPPKKSPGKKSKASAKEGKVSSTSSALLSLDASYEAPIDLPVALILQDAREMVGLLRKLGKRILERSRLDGSLLEELPARATALDKAELAWASARKIQLPTLRKKLRKQAEELRSDTIAALRHFALQDTTTQAKLDRIVEGSGLADLIDDLKKLAPLVDRHRPLLGRSGLPEQAAEQLAGLASSLEEATENESAERAGNEEARQALALRNRAYWHLREATDEIRECARYAFRNEPELARLFRSLNTTRRGKTTARSPTPTP
jgi:hypothetical protein